MLKKWFAKTKKFCKEHPEVVIAGGAIVASVALSALIDGPKKEITDFKYSNTWKVARTLPVEFEAIRYDTVGECGFAAYESENVRQCFTSTPDNMIALCQDVIDIANEMKGEK